MRKYMRAEFVEGSRMGKAMKDFESEEIAGDLVLTMDQNGKVRYCSVVAERSDHYLVLHVGA